MASDEEPGFRTWHRIVVGIDGSTESKQALRWAAAEARLRGALLSVVHVWGLPAALSDAQPLYHREVIDALRLEATQLVGRELVELGDETSGIEIEYAVPEGAPAPCLLEAAQGADLLVLGSRSHGGFEGLRLGSVSQQCAQHAICPVVIVPPEKR